MNKWPAIVIGAVDAVLLTVILLSAVTGWRIGVPKKTTNEPPLKPTVSATEKTVPKTEALTDAPVAETTKKPEPSIRQCSPTTTRHKVSAAVDGCG